MRPLFPRRCLASGSQAPLFLSMILDAAIVPGIDLPGVVAGVADGIAVGALGAIVVVFAVVGRGGAVAALAGKQAMQRALFILMRLRVLLHHRIWWYVCLLRFAWFTSPSPYSAAFNS